MALIMEDFMDDFYGGLTPLGFKGLLWSIYCLLGYDGGLR